MHHTCWQQQFSNFKKALKTLTDAVELSNQRPLSKLEQQGLIQGFEFTHELAWNVFKDYLEEQGYVGLIGSKNATRTAFKNELLADGDVWMDMIKARNLSSHTYNTEIAEKVATDILENFYPAFIAMEAVFSGIEKNVQE
ncbi:nucleotidyltransferase substrate binding protein [Deltaproteobacteria bacterium]|nr:nucleotidyltransferase substrate binding protein [Deltaproteobacteria bacterium]